MNQTEAIRQKMLQTRMEKCVKFQLVTLICAGLFYTFAKNETVKNAAGLLGVPLISGTIAAAVRREVYRSKVNQYLGITTSVPTASVVRRTPSHLIRRAIE